MNGKERSAAAKDRALFDRLGVPGEKGRREGLAEAHRRELKRRRWERFQEDAADEIELW